MKSHSVLASLLTGTVVSVVFSPVINAEEQEAVIVTATRTAQTVDETMASVSVITREDIEASQNKSLMELLSAKAGIDMARNGGYGKTTSLFLRGTESDHILVLIDGVKVGSATSGGAAWEYLPPEQIERIEIVRGPRSSLYGSEAIGGVIQIFTRKPEPGKDALTTTAMLGAGSNNTREAATGINGRRRNKRYSLHAAHFNTDGIDARQPTTGAYAVNEPDKDGYDNTSLSARYGHRFSKKFDTEFSLFYVEGNSEFDSTGNDETDYKQQSVNANFTLNPSERFTAKLLMGQSKDETYNYRDNGASTPTRFDTHRDVASWQNDWAINDTALVSVGLDYQNDKVDSTTTYSRTSRDNTGLYLQYQDSFGPTDVMLGGRMDDNEQFGSHSTGNFGLGYTIAAKTRLLFNVGTAFKAPTFNELYYPYYGDPNNQPEESRSMELALQQHQANQHLQLSYFRTDIDNLIAYNADTGLAGNVDSAYINGVEMEGRYVFDDWRINVNLTNYFNLKDTDSGKQLARRAKRSARFEVSHRLAKSEYGVDWLVQGPRYDNSSNTRKLGGYGVVNLFAAYNFNKTWALKGRIENLFDKEYQTANTYNSLGRSAYIHVTMHIK